MIWPGASLVFAGLGAAMQAIAGAHGSDELQPDADARGPAKPMSSTRWRVTTAPTMQPCAMVVPYGVVRANSGSTWIGLKSADTSA